MDTHEQQGSRGDRGQAFPRADATVSAVPDVAHQRFGHLDIVDIPAYLEGRLVGYRLNVPYDWDTLSPELMNP